jgi:hypothetical protein
VGGNSVWYRIVPQETAVLRIYINATSAANYFNTLLAVYKGTNPSDFNLVAENDDMGYTTMSEVTLTVKPGNMYYVAVDGFNNDGNIATGNFRIRFEKLAVPMNDTELVGPHMRFPSKETGFAAGTNRNATKDAGEPNLTANVGGKSVWYAWTAPQSRGPAALRADTRAVLRARWHASRCRRRPGPAGIRAARSRPGLAAPRPHSPLRRPPPGRSAPRPAPARYSRRGAARRPRPRAAPGAASRRW